MLAATLANTSALSAWLESNMAMIPDVDALISLVREAARAELLPRFARAERCFKGDGSIVTAADLALQARLSEGLARLVPGLPLLAEEMPREEQVALLSNAAAGPLWCLDPLDGTSNFAAGIPFFSVSLALLSEGRVLLGLVYDPLRDECFSAQQGQGAVMNRRTLRPVEDLPLSRGIAMIDSKRLAIRAARFLANPPYSSQRNFGSVALEWCWLAAGRCQLYLHGRQALWDYAAGLLILQEAGGRATTLDGEAVFALSLSPRTVLAASTPSLFAEGRAWLETTG